MEVDVPDGDRPAAPAPARPYTSRIEIAFPDVRAARTAAAALSVDEELSPERVSRWISVERRSGGGGVGGTDAAADGDDDDDGRVLLVRFEATEARMLRVAMSSFYDSLSVVLRCLQEFDGERFDA
eukprot:CAMPEP_0194282350 /NCGR_PEP_ID=MMETSP0169-20130528/22973_1 /TAXON_ID=218684 /ORGANISM="Corethron pennatum, Strain L29A3" /LENGTH=125 /DNA_ID=CAMNT_0039027641 /DNA_START=129 /DNA_END=506 /DNA_ORIENTATION=-